MDKPYVSDKLTRAKRMKKKEESESCIWETRTSAAYEPKHVSEKLTRAKRIARKPRVRKALATGISRGEVEEGEDGIAAGERYGGIAVLLDGFGDERKGGARGGHLPDREGEAAGGGEQTVRLREEEVGRGEVENAKGARDRVEGA